MLYTRKGDNGTTHLVGGQTGTFGCDGRISKNSSIVEALGAVDEINSYLGICKVKSKDFGSKIRDLKIDKIIHEIQENLFIIQAELAGSEISIKAKKIKDLEKITNKIEKLLPKIKNFSISGGTELSAMFDFSRTIARRAERRVVTVYEEKNIKIGRHTISYLNRLSSILYALSRLTNHLSGIAEESPKYK